MRKRCKFIIKCIRKRFIFKCRNLNDFFRPHHTISAVGLYGLREALAEIIDEGVESFRERHVDNAQRLYEGLMNIGLELFVEKAQERLPTITSVRIPHGLNFPKIQNYLMERYVHG